MKRKTRMFDKEYIELANKRFGRFSMMKKSVTIGQRFVSP